VAVAVCLYPVQRPHQVQSRCVTDKQGQHPARGNLPAQS
jgi:hypothetical protein